MKRPHETISHETTNSIEVHENLDPSECIDSQPAEPEAIEGVKAYVKQQEDSTKAKALIIEVYGSLDPSEYIDSQPAGRETIEEVKAYVKQQEESAKNKTLIRLTNTIECSLLVSFFLVFVTVLNPGSDKTVAKELLPQTMASQVVLLRIVLNSFRANNKR